jgi:hypothetical protein
VAVKTASEVFDTYRKNLNISLEIFFTTPGLPLVSLMNLATCCVQGTIAVSIAAYKASAQAATYHKECVYADLLSPFLGGSTFNDTLQLFVLKCIKYGRLDLATRMMSEILSYPQGDERTLLHDLLLCLVKEKVSSDDVWKWAHVNVFDPWFHLHEIGPITMQVLWLYEKVVAVRHEASMTGIATCIVANLDKFNVDSFFLIPALLSRISQSIQSPSTVRPYCVLLESLHGRSPRPSCLGGFDFERHALRIGLSVKAFRVAIGNSIAITSNQREAVDSSYGQLVKTLATTHLACLTRVETDSREREAEQIVFSKLIFVMERHQDSTRAKDEMPDAMSSWSAERRRRWILFLYLRNANHTILDKPTRSIITWHNNWLVQMIRDDSTNPLTQPIFSPKLFQTQDDDADKASGSCDLIAWLGDTTEIPSDIISFCVLPFLTESLDSM